MVEVNRPNRQARRRYGKSRMGGRNGHPHTRTRTRHSRSDTDRFPRRKRRSTRSLRRHLLRGSRAAGGSTSVLLLLQARSLSG
ncbi:MAG: hypothetical protein ACJAYU_004427 [Bradymonadia bacterium]